MKISSAEQKANSILRELFIDSDLKKIKAKGRSQEKIELIRGAVHNLLGEGIPTAVVGKSLNLCRASVQYHARKLEAQGKLKRNGLFWGNL